MVKETGFGFWNLEAYSQHFLLSYSRKGETSDLFFPINMSALLEFG